MTTTDLKDMKDPISVIAAFARGAYNLGLRHHPGETSASWEKHQERFLAGLLQRLEYCNVDGDRCAVAVKQSHCCGDTDSPS